MIQRNFHITKNNSLTVEAVADSVAATDEYRNAAQVLLCVFIESWEREYIEGFISKIRNLLPKAEIAGISHHYEVIPQDGTKINIIMNFLFFEKPSFSKIHYEIPSGPDTEMGAALNGIFRTIPELKGVMLLAAEFGRNMDIILEEAEKGLTDIPLFGAPGVVSPRFRESSEITEGTELNYVFDENGCFFNRVIAVAFHGNNVHIMASYNLGWTPVGATMTITSMEGDNIVKEIDGQPAGDIYRKYLGLSYPQIEIINICEFPLVAERNGRLIGRIPVKCMDNGSLMFAVPFKTGEKIRFTYGAQFRIFSEVYRDSLDFKDFAPQGMLLIVCGNRLIFLKDDEKHEVDHYRQIAPELAVLHGGAELWRLNGQGGELNSALIAVGIREGDAVPIEKDIIRGCQCEESIREGDIVPLEYRVMNFMYSVTEDLERMTRQANAANEAKSAFLSNMTHEIRSPINAVLGMDEMILRESSEEDIIDYAENIKSAGGTLLGLVNDVLDMSKIEAGKMAIIPVEYHTASVINDLVTMISQRAQDKGLELILDISPDIPSALYGDEIRLKQIITNILTNAVKYTEKGSVTLRISKKSESGETAVIEVGVKDTGIGIKDEDIAKLFKAFERIEEKRNRNIEGTGLGMNITSALLNMMDSELHVNSVYGEGSDFYFQLEQRIIDPTPVGDYQEALRRVRSRRERYHESFTAPEARILVVDDTPMNLLVLKNLLKQTKVQIFTADSGERCLVMIRKEKYDMIFLDDRMPGMSGVETLAEMRSTEHLNKAVPVVILTANSADDAESYYMDKGFSDYLAKPIDPQTLENMLKKYLPAEKIHIIDAKKTGTEDNAQATAYSEDLINDARRVYLESLEENAALIDGYYSSEQWDDYTIRVHALKSSSRIIGEAELGDLAEKLENAGDNRDLDFIRAHHNEFMELYRSVPDKYSSAADEASKRSEIPVGELEEALDAIHELAASFDFDSINGIMEQLGEYSIPENMRERFDRVKQAVINIDWVNM